LVFVIEESLGDPASLAGRLSEVDAPGIASMEESEKESL
jgi:hypothetical protein